ncbi:methyltransferase domain-containing protein [Streptomyces sp. WMMC897]|uniref:methyltransferase domain-containing protein n=1 Tax=Streptomyces sp. WMMC897 TaxID=3014782 RepID=UPI0022B701DE|nr:methyltransferase domain-containing protein [Streptomyces sp. WMMC897]MCZ7413050.1 methyltransferase domain-containing protein [Streptomyces sp. WMMC897]MCZ7413138.1 methyltransferase domain-containing protein [Streptomyces sp. WMMC897]MCZ7415478.1 methyltransferase domain-containing protein [Streptomyces sp. WMMC897]
MNTHTALAQQLADAGHLTDDWHEAFTQVRREDFIPARIWVRATDGYHPVDRATHPDRWRELANSDTALVTQVADPPGTPTPLTPTSSASMPRIVAHMLDHLDVHDGARVLEIGTGTGYNAALLCHRLGSDRVTSVEVDPELAETARAALKAAGYTPTIRTGDGTRGAPDDGPFDRVIVTCALHHIPPALVEQTTAGGIIVAPWGTGLYNGVLARLTADGDGTAHGPVVGDSAFMWNRGEAPDRDVMALVHDDHQPTTGRTALDPRNVLGDENAAFTAGILVPGCRYSVGHGPDGEFTLWLGDLGTGSWASVDYTPGAREFEVQQHGPRALWDEIERAHDWWVQAGSPERTRYGITVGRDGQHVWLDTPDRVVA